MLKNYMPRRVKLFATIALVGGLLFLSSSIYAIAQGYVSEDTGLQPGMVVKLSQSSTPDVPKVERATRDQPDRAIGVVTTVDQSTLTIGSGGQTIYVEGGGEVEVFASDVNGKINKGDLLTLSPLNGILAKHVDGSQAVFGLALEDFPPQPKEIHSIQTTEGEKTTGIASIKINLDQKSALGREGRSTLARYGEAIVGKQVSDIRVAVALLIFIIVLIAEGAILYGAISSAVSSIGRNPLARQYIKRELLKVMIVAFFVLLFGLGSIYLILWV
jgi:hypothetical protein